MQLNWENFNEMSYNKICEISGIGKKVASRIIAMRPYRENNDLFKVKGLGATTLKRIGIEKIKKNKKERRTWYLMPDGIEYPTYSLATDTFTGQIDFFWRIDKERRAYL